MRDAMLGIVNLDKPVGPTSHDMVGLLRRLTGTRRIGHAGTLDPLASGVLPILVGVATRLSEELTGGEKRYTAVARLGWTSATDDAEGPVDRGAPPPDEGAVAEMLQSFVGTFEQRPPAFSARKQGGRTAHRAARAGEPLDLPLREVTVSRIEVLDMMRRDDETLDVRFDLRCGAGTYVRSLARDLGERLGCGGYLVELRRTEAAGLRDDDAWTPAQLEELSTAGRLSDALLTPATVLPLPRLALAPDAATRFIHGSSLRLPDPVDAGRHAVFDGERLVGIGTVNAGILQPNKVLVDAAG
jgi:tRNA pseudouridine55 synthase